MAEDSGLMPHIESPSGDYSSQAASGANTVTRQHAEMTRRAKEEDRALFVGPNGDLTFLDETDDYLNHQYLAGRHASALTSAVKLIRDPKPGYMYVWAAKYDLRSSKLNAKTVGHIRSGRYEPVLVEELAEDIDAPIESHKIGSTEGIAGMFDVLLMAVNPKAQRELYRWKAAEARQRTNRQAGFRKLQDRVASISGGGVQVESEVR